MILSKARISKYDPTTGHGEIKLSQEGKGQSITSVSIPQPYVGRNWGIMAGIETETIVMVDQDPNEDTKVVSFQTNPDFFRATRDQDFSEVYDKETLYRELKEGEIILHSKANSAVFLNNRGGIELSTSDGNTIEVNKATDTITQLSLNNNTLTEAARIRNGLIKRDLRSEEEKIDDLFLSSTVTLDTSRDEVLDILGADPSHTSEDLTGAFDPAEGKSKVSGTDAVKSLNPALTEYRIDAFEFGDGINGISLPSTKREGRLPENVAGRLILGTVANEDGSLPRFDYTFGTGEAKGHGNIWKVPGVNDAHRSNDFTEKEAVVRNATGFNTAQMFQLALNTRGADHKGSLPSSTNPGSIWSFAVDKEGLTKWNIPASTSLEEPHREGRSVLWNMDGSLTQSIGKEVGNDFESIVTDSEINATTKRLDRSWTADFEGNIEWRVGADQFGQSLITHTDGGVTFRYGQNKSLEPSVVSSIDTAGLTAPSKSGRRIGSSVSGILDGSLELDIGVNDATNRQSVALNANGMISMTVGTDSVKDSLKLEAAGNIKFKVANGGHKFEMLSFDSPGSFKDAILLQHGGATKSLFQIQNDGKIIIRNSLANSNIMIGAQGDITIVNGTGNKISMAPDGTIGIGGATAGIDISPTLGVVLRTSGGSFTLNPTGKVEVAANAGMTVTGPFMHLNNTQIALGPGASTSPYTVAAIGPGHLDPFTGNPCSVGGFATIKGG